MIATAGLAWLAAFNVWALPATAADAAVDAAYGFLYRQMDRLRRAVLVCGEAEYHAYYPSGKMGAAAELSVNTGCGDLSGSADHGGCLRVDYHPSPAAGAGRWAGLYLQWPENNWGKFAGRDLRGATRLSFRARSVPAMQVEFVAGGINRRPGPELPFGDSFGPKPLSAQLDEQWRSFTIPLTGEDLSSVIGPLAIMLASAKGSRPGSVFLADVEIDLPALNEPRLVQSYLPGTCLTGAPANIAYIYDQALVVLALLARGNTEDLRRAELIAQALVLAQDHDRFFKDGRLRNAYASGPLLEPASGPARLPGYWAGDESSSPGHFLEDEFSAGSDTGSAAWAGLALIQAHALLPPRAGAPYLNAARGLGEWIVRENRVEEAAGGFRGGYEGFEPGQTHPRGQVPSLWRSTEHNIDLVAFFGHLAAAVDRDSEEGRKWLGELAHARRFVEHMIVGGQAGGHLWTGTRAGDEEFNTTVVPLDAQTWAVLAMGQPSRYQPALEWALRHCGAGDIPNGFDFNCNDGDGAWWEGTAQVAAALKSLGRQQQAVPILARLQQAQIKTGPAAGALPAASRCGLTTGFEQHWQAEDKTKAWLYPDTPHIGATAWFIFAALGKNPYYLAPLREAGKKVAGGKHGDGR